MKSTLFCLSVLILGAIAAPNIPDGRILGGIPAEPGQLPYQASINFCIQGNCQHICGGAIIGDRWILSAAHCITQAPGLGSYQVVVGAVDLSEHEGPGRQAARVALVTIHPDYDGGINPHDIAVYELVEPLQFNEQVRPIDLQEEEEHLDEPVIISGWGSMGNDIPNLPSHLQYIETPILDPHDCQRALDSVLGGASHPLDVETNLCTGPLTGGVSACTGDTGSPVANVHGDHLLGIVSWFVTPCGTVGAPSIHVKVSHYSGWIRSIIRPDDEPQP